MNLGSIYVQAFFVLFAAPTIVSFALLGLLRHKLKISCGSIVLFALFVAPIAGMLLNYAFHEPTFVAWHQAQNRYVPQTGCLTYRPQFSRLYATYRMTLPQFNAWATAHPWDLMPGGNSLVEHDAAALGFDNPVASFETEMAPNGKQLRVYFQSGTMYLSYNSM